jgi:hypothetical protein
MRTVDKAFVGKPERNRPIERPRRRWGNIRMGLRQIGCEVVNWIYLAQDREQWRAVVNMVMNLRFPLKVWNFLTS